MSLLFLSILMWFLYPKCFSLFFVDRHLMPQFFHILNYWDYCPKAKLTFYSYEDMGSVLETDLKMNISNQGLMDMARRVMKRKRPKVENDIRFNYRPDWIMYDEFMGKTLSFAEVKARFREEVGYFDHFSIGLGF